MTRFTLPLLAALTLTPVFAQKSFEFWPGAAYDAKIPTVKQVLGYEPGEKVTNHAGLMQYLDALAAAAPAHIKVVEYGKSWEGRKLVYAAIGSESNLRRIAEIRNGTQRLADPRKTNEAEAKKLITSLPTVVWLSYGVHGNEISSPDAALLTAYHLLAARNDKLVNEVLTKVVVLIDPTQNPDGRDRFVNYFEMSRGLEPDASPNSAEHNEPWPGGRVNHYLFDLNRDWIGLTQPEISSQVRALREWLPQVYVDLHEMGGETTYFFTPESDPYNPHLTSTQRATLSLFGKNNARWFDKYGFDYFTREEYDAFYPGYGASWPLYYGAIAMTYEQASVRGLVYKRADENLLTYRDTVRHHFVASVSTLEAAAANREKLLGDFYAYRVSAIEEGRKEPVQAYILPRGTDAGATDKLVGILLEHGIEVDRARAAFKSGDKEFPAGTYVVPLAQPSKRLIRTLLDADVKMDDKFVAGEEIRRKRKQPSEIYDVTAWSLPLLFNVEAIQVATPVTGSFEPAHNGRIVPGQVHGAGATVAYLVPWGNQASGRLLAAALRQDLKVHSSDKAFTQDGVKFPAGSLILKVAQNPADLGERLARIARETGAEVFGTNSGWVEDGVNFGSRWVVALKKPAIAMAWDTPTQSGSAGATRFVLERQFGYPVTPIRASQLGRADLSKFQVLILPSSSSYASTLGESGIAKVKGFVSAGGTLIALGDAAGFLGDKKVGLIELVQENALRDGEDKDKDKKDDKKDKEGRIPGTAIATEADFEKAARATSELPDDVPGAIARVKIRPDYWLTAGVAETVYTMVEGQDIFAPVKSDKGINAAYYEAADKLVASGYLWAENKKQLAFKPLVVSGTSGRGIVIGFTQDPNFRAIEDGMNTLFLNAVFRGPAHAQR
jgi:hypothetical protein